MKLILKNILVVCVLTIAVLACGLPAPTDTDTSQPFLPGHGGACGIKVQHGE